MAARSDICALLRDGERANGRIVVLQAVANGPMLEDPDCPGRMIAFRFDQQAQRSERVSSYRRETERLMWSPPYKSIRINGVGRFAWQPQSEFGNMFVISELRSFDLVDNDLQTACSFMGRSDEFCNCLQASLGRKARPDIMDSLLAVSLDAPSPANREAFRAAISNARYARPAIREAFAQCSANRAW